MVLSPKSVVLDCFDNGKANAKMGLLPYDELRSVCRDKWSATKFLFVEGILEKPDLCSKCGSGVSFKKDPFVLEAKYEKNLVTKPPSEEKACFIYRCKNRNCSASVSLFKNTFFENGKKPPQQILMFLHLWLTGANVPTLKSLTGWSEPCVLQYCSLMRKMVSSLIINWLQCEVNPEIYTYENAIGGPGVEVQIDESAFGKRKYGRGHAVDTKWVFGGIEILVDEKGRRSGGNFFSVVVLDRKRDTLFDAIRKFILPGSIIVSDCLKSYDTIREIEGYNFTHFSVNHSEHYKCPATGACTNTIEGKWNALKKNVPRQGFRSDEVLQEYLGEQMWRYANKGHLWEAAIKSMSVFVKYQGDV